MTEKGGIKKYSRKNTHVFSMVTLGVACDRLSRMCGMKFIASSRAAVFVKTGSYSTWHLITANPRWAVSTFLAMVGIILTVVLYVWAARQDECKRLLLSKVSRFTTPIVGDGRLAGIRYRDGSEFRCP